MAGTESLTLAKALSIKNRLAGRLSQAKSNIEAYNCVQVGQRSVGSVDVRAEYDRYQRLAGAIVGVKTAIQRANAPIYEDVLRLGELKAEVQMLSALQTKQGKEAGYGGIEMEYDSTLLKPEVLGRVRALEGEIDTIQDRLLQYNATTRVELSGEVLDLAR